MKLERSEIETMIAALSIAMAQAPTQVERTRYLWLRQKLEKKLATGGGEPAELAEKNRALEMIATSRGLRPSAGMETALAWCRGVARDVLEAWK